jgi:hypothetical protein
MRRFGRRKIVGKQASFKLEYAKNLQTWGAIRIKVNFEVM